MYSNSISADNIKSRLYIPNSGTANIGSLGIQNNGNVWIGCLNIVHRLDKRVPPFITQCFIKSAIGLICTHKIVGSIDNLPIEDKNGLLDSTNLRYACRQTLIIGI